MIDGVVKQIDKAAGKLVVELEGGREVTLTVNEETPIAVMELETAGEAVGTIDDIGVGYLVSLDITEAEGGCTCHGLSCIS